MVWQAVLLTVHLVVSQGFSAAIRTEVQELMRCILDVQREQSRAKFFRECEAKHLTEHVHRLEEELDRKTPSSPDIANRMKLLRLSAQVWAAITTHARARARTAPRAATRLRVCTTDVGRGERCALGTTRARSTF